MCYYENRIHSRGDFVRKVSAYFVAIVTALVSLVAMLVFDYVLSLLYYFMGKVPFMVGIIDFIGEVLDLGLTALLAAVVANTIWGLGHKLVQKIYDQKIPYDKSPVDRVNGVFCLVFLVVLVFVGYHFFVNIGSAVAFYTEGLTGLGKILMFLKAAKETFLYVRSEFIWIYKIGFNSMILTIISMFVTPETGV